MWTGPTYRSVPEPWDDPTPPASPPADMPAPASMPTPACVSASASVTAAVMSDARSRPAGPGRPGRPTLVRCPAAADQVPGPFCESVEDRTRPRTRVGRTRTGRTGAGSGRFGRGPAPTIQTRAEPGGADRGRPGRCDPSGAGFCSVLVSVVLLFAFPGDLPSSGGVPAGGRGELTEAGQAVFRQAMLPRMVAMSAGSVHGLTIAKRVTVSPSWTVGVTKAKPVCNSFSVHS
ncbi:hypothetical protein FDG2_6343 [Candidatus Protofrankia californiensis]|uniref:Uncharacterized protein n=1 Tax=Candidatus Protofrankia californiensis TaxID=1839754 RepID=A0A1C3PGU5_9ACTN|nr:hypothetical protein FDG2_6343 [Candidatus Protofrankia californiensis]